VLLGRSRDPLRFARAVDWYAEHLVVVAVERGVDERLAPGIEVDAAQLGDAAVAIGDEPLLECERIDDP